MVIPLELVLIIIFLISMKKSHIKVFQLKILLKVKVEENLLLLKDQKVLKEEQILIMLLVMVMTLMMELGHKVIMIFLQEKKQ